MTKSEALRLAIREDATSCSIRCSYATGYPRALPPVRKIGLGRRALAGMLPGTKLAHDQIAKFESSLERDFFVLLEFNPDVQRWDPQPVRLRVEETGRDYTPDVLVSFYPKGSERQPRRVLYEVKYRDELRQKWAELKPRLKAARRYAKTHGWEFRIITECEIREGGLLWNAKFLLPYVYDEPVDPDISVLIANLRRLGISTPDKLLKACSTDRWEQARLLTVLWQQVAARHVRADLSERLTMNSEIWIDD